MKTLIFAVLSTAPLLSAQALVVTESREGTVSYYRAVHHLDPSECKRTYHPNGSFGGYCQVKKVRPGSDASADTRFSGVETKIPFGAGTPQEGTLKLWCVQDACEFFFSLKKKPVGKLTWEILAPAVEGELREKVEGLIYTEYLREDAWLDPKPDPRLTVTRQDGSFIRERMPLRIDLAECQKNWKGDGQASCKMSGTPDENLPRFSMDPSPSATVEGRRWNYSAPYHFFSKYYGPRLWLTGNEKLAWADAVTSLTQAAAQFKTQTSTRVTFLAAPSEALPAAVRDLRAIKTRYTFEETDFDRCAAAWDGRDCEVALEQKLSPVVSVRFASVDTTVQLADGTKLRVSVYPSRIGWTAYFELAGSWPGRAQPEFTREQIRESLKLAVASLPAQTLEATHAE